MPKPPLRQPSSDLIGRRADIRSGRVSARSELERQLEVAADPRVAPAFVHIEPSRIRASFERRLPAPDSPLAGLTVSIKDLFDVSGEVTAAGSVVMAAHPTAPSDAVAVARLRRAGATLMGRTHMSEFAYSGVGINPHCPALYNWSTMDLDATPRVPGGSSSGAAASVAAGASWAGLGTDTGGSIRIPAALHGLVGFKPTARTVPTAGAYPLSTTLDSIGAITRSVRDASLLHGLLSASTVIAGTASLRDLRLAVPGQLFFDDMDDVVARTIERALGEIRAAGIRVETIDLPELRQFPHLLANGGFAAAESYALHRTRLSKEASRYDPRVLSRIQRGAAISAADYLDLIQLRRDWIEAMGRAIAPYDAIVAPTVPVIAPAWVDLAPAQPGDHPSAVTARDDAFFRINSLLLRNPSVVNLLDGCAVTLPCHRPGEWPVGLMLWHGAMRDDGVLHAARCVESVLNQGRMA